MLVLLPATRLAPRLGRLSCVAELADWDDKTILSPLSNDSMYVMVYDAGALLPASLIAGHNVEDFVQLDGLGRTIHFVRLEDFTNWCDPGACAH